MRFEGFGEHAVEYYDGLLADNSKAYYEDNKQIYLEQVRAPMEALLAELEGEFGEFGTGKVFRPYRDLRFAKDKTPYKTHCGAVLERGRGGGALYMQLSSDGLLVGAGCFHTEPDQLARLRTALDEDRRGGELQDLIDGLTRKGWELRGDTMKTKPRGVAPDHPRLELLRHRSLYLVREWEPDNLLHERGLLRRVRDSWRTARPLTEWFVDHVGV
ncbi:DUF2461 domain-containing protein [Sciscionella marina]|uniref:DUF2461 domain-containing protein n=1 Tax=Sciscionella marina TaxID=508770 RepID=UPI00037A9962|nr:DUF2461 domain-containing protein [Sciscionella marina]